MLSLNLTRSENELLSRIIDMPGITVRILRSAMYQLKKRTGQCITTTCKRKALPNEVRCEHCQRLNRQYATAHHKKDKVNEE